MNTPQRRSCFRSTTPTRCTVLLPSLVLLLWSAEASSSSATWTLHSSSRSTIISQIVSRRALFATTPAGAFSRNPAVPQSRLDLDYAALEEQLVESIVESIVESSTQPSLDLYRKGGYAASFARLKLRNPIGRLVGAGTPVLGRSADGREVRGTVLQDELAHSNYLEVLYDELTDCRVGALPQLGMAQTQGCKQQQPHGNDTSLPSTPTLGC